MREVIGVHPGLVPPLWTKLDIIWPEPGTSLDLVILADAPVGVGRHWAQTAPGGKTHSVWCPGPATCPRCLAGAEREWSGYLAVYEWSRKKVKCLVMGLRTWSLIDATFPAGESLRYRRIIVTRAGPYRNSPCAVTRSDRQDRLPAIPPIDLRETLMVIYGEKAFPVPAEQRGDTWEEPK